MRHANPRRDTSYSRAASKPILMTSLTTVLGMIPLALGLGSGGEVLQALGISVAAGLAISTPLCLYLIPAVLWLLDRDDTRSPLRNEQHRTCLALAPMEGVTDFPLRLWLWMCSGLPKMSTPFLRVTASYQAPQLA